MELLAQVQTMVVEQAFTVGMGLLVALIAAVIAWFWFSRGSSVKKSDVLVNQARVNEADMDGQGSMPMPHQDESEKQVVPQPEESDE